VRIAVVSVATLVILGVGLLQLPKAPAAAARGDVDGNGVVNSIDAFLLLQYGAGLITNLPDGTPRPGGPPPKDDADGNGFVNALDALLILQFHAGLIDSLGT